MNDIAYLKRISEETSPREIITALMNHWAIPPLDKETANRREQELRNRWSQLLQLCEPGELLVLKTSLGHMGHDCKELLDELDATIHLCEEET